MLTIQGTKGNNKLLLGNKGGSMETEFYKIFTALCEERGVKKTRACIEALGSKNMYKRWEEGSYPNVDSLKKLSAYFGVSMSYLVGEESTNVYDELTDAQKALVRLVSRLTDQEVSILISQVKGIILGQ